MEALSIAVQVNSIHRQKSGQPRPDDLLIDPADAKLNAPTRVLDEAESKTVLASYGLETPEFCVSNRDQAADNAQKIGFPVALKLISNEISHKAKMGGVKLSLDSITAVDDAIVEITRAVAQHGGNPIDNFLLERMIDGPRGEYIIGIKRQAALGLAMMIGRGGVNTEALNSHRTVLLPLVDADLIRAVASIGLHKTSTGYGSMLAAAHAVAAYALDHRHRLQTLDVNPLIVTESGAAIAADALIVLSTEN